MLTEYGQKELPRLALQCCLHPSDKGKDGPYAMAVGLSVPDRRASGETPKGSRRPGQVVREQHCPPQLGGLLLMLVLWSYVPM